MKTILVVEDDSSLQSVVVLRLKNAGFTVLTAKTVEEGITQLQNNHIDLIWSDHYLLGKLNGIDLVTQVKNTPAWKDIPVIIVSQTSTDESLSKYNQLGVTKLYTKMNTNLDGVIEYLKGLLATIEQKSPSTTSA
jgi:CheY-like chemotaxis protein